MFALQLSKLCSGNISCIYDPRWSDFHGNYRIICIGLNRRMARNALEAHAHLAPIERCGADVTYGHDQSEAPTQCISQKAVSAASCCVLPGIREWRGSERIVTRSTLGQRSLMDGWIPGQPDRQIIASLCFSHR